MLSSCRAGQGAKVDLAQALLYAIYAQDADTVVALLDEGADVHYKDADALYQAVKLNEYYFVKVLCKHGANPLAADGVILAEATLNRFAALTIDELFRR